MNHEDTLRGYVDKHVPERFKTAFLLYLIENRCVSFPSEESFLYHYQQWYELRLPKTQDVARCREIWDGKTVPSADSLEDPVLDFCRHAGLAVLKDRGDGGGAPFKVEFGENALRDFERALMFNSSFWASLNNKAYKAWGADGGAFQSEAKSAGRFNKALLAISEIDDPAVRKAFKAMLECFEN